METIETNILYFAVCLNLQVGGLYQFLRDHQYLPHRIVGCLRPERLNGCMKLQQLGTNQSGNDWETDAVVWLHVPSIPEHFTRTFHIVR